MSSWLPYLKGYRLPYRDAMFLRKRLEAIGCANLSAYRRRKAYRLMVREWFYAADRRCEACWFHDTEPHHPHYATLGTPAEPICFVPLCVRCHERLHERIVRRQSFTLAHALEAICAHHRELRATPPQPIVTPEELRAILGG